MNIKILFPCVSLLAGCSSLEMSNPEPREMIYPIDMNYEAQTSEAKPLPHFVKTSEVPQAHVSAKNNDISWVEEQQPNHLTIMLASDTKPLAVSHALMDAPKDQRGAVIKYEKNGQIYYSGVYGSFLNPENAQNALEQLPQSLRVNAKIMPWSSMQQLHFI
jgi:septal ring-binding cell division protein DamX